MKIRLDYVSNSSSSSFFIVGHTFSGSDVVEALKTHKVRKNYLDCINDYIEKDKLKEKFDLDTIIDYENEDYYIGLEFSSMYDEETKEEFINRAERNLKKLFGEDIKAEEICGDIYC